MSAPAEKTNKQMPSGKSKRGRKKGGKNRATILRETKQAEVIAAAIDSGKPLAITVLQRMMEFAEGAVATFKPTTKAEEARGMQANPDGSLEEFGKWFDRWAKVTMDLASYQSAKIKAMDKPTAPPEPGKQGERKRFTLRVFEGGRQVAGPTGGAVDDGIA